MGALLVAGVNPPLSFLAPNMGLEEGVEITMDSIEAC